MSPEAAAGRVAVDRVYGVVTGVVLDNDDPQGLGRVRIKFPWVIDEEVGHWARVAVPMAGPDRGMRFLPEVDDEVLVAFEAGDVTRPYVLGALWNGQDKPPADDGSGKNNQRLIKSRSGHVIRLDDSDGSEKVEVIDKSGDNSVTIDTASNTITIASAADISIEAPQGTIKLTAKNVEVSTSADTKVGAQGGLTLDGTPGTTAVKGTTVNIN